MKDRVVGGRTERNYLREVEKKGDKDVARRRVERPQ